MVWAWGDNSFGELGNGTNVSDSALPVQVLGFDGTGTLSNIIAVASGNKSLHSLALRSDGTVWSWGSNDAGELGTGTTDSNGHPTPIEVVGPGGSGFLTGITAVAVGTSQCMALRSDGTVWTWGFNTYGQLGNNTTTNSPTPVQVLGANGMGHIGAVTAIAAGNGSDLALQSDGAVWAWGYNGDGELGNNTTTNSLTPVQVLGKNGIGHISGVTAIACGYFYALALTSNGTVLAWGDNTNGALGDGTTIQRKVPVQVTGLTNVIALAAGSQANYSMALESNGTVWAWGNGATTPAQVVGVGGSGYLTGIIAIASSGGTAPHNLALKNDGTVYAWGDNFAGDLGLGTTDSSYHSTPVQVKNASGAGALTHITALAAGPQFTLALTGYQLAWQNTQTGDTVQWLLSGSQLISSSEIQANVGTGWFLVGAADFNGDGDNDLLWQNTSTGEVGYWPMNGGSRLGYTQIAAPGFVPPSTGWRVVGAANFSGGSVPNILWQNIQTGEVGYWTLSNGAFQSYTQIAPPSIVNIQRKVVGTPNFLGTGSPQILLQNETTGEIGYWTAGFGGALTYTQIEPAGVVPLVWQARATADVTGSGTSDIIWQNTSTGEVGYWTMVNGQNQGYTQIKPPGIVPAGWQIGAAL
jgi:alpha-tubulin suppressor-like RCC1 family protein